MLTCFLFNLNKKSKKLVGQITNIVKEELLFSNKFLEEKTLNVFIEFIKDNGCNESEAIEQKIIYNKI